MHIACDKKKLIENINIVQKCVSARTTSPILECILLIADRAGFRMLANDMELSIETTDIENTDVFKLGEVALNAKMLFDIIRTMPDGMIDIECDENFITTIKNGRSNFRISGLDGSEFPRPKEIEGAGVSAVKGDILKSMVKQTIFSIAAVDYRPILTGELLEFKGSRFNMVAVDGHRIAYRTELLGSESAGSKIVVPGKALNEISRLADDDEDVSLTFNDKFVKISLKSCVLTSRLLEGDFIDYANMFTNDYKTCIKVNRSKLMNSLERCMLLIAREIKKVEVIFEISDGVLKLSAENSIGEVKDEIDIDFEGDDLRIGFSPKYLIDICRAVDEEELNMYFISSLSPCIVKSSIGNEGFNYLVLPVKI